MPLQGGMSSTGNEVRRTANGEVRTANFPGRYEFAFAAPFKTADLGSPATIIVKPELKSPIFRTFLVPVLV